MKHLCQSCQSLYLVLWKGVGKDAIYFCMRCDKLDIIGLRRNIA